jgi:hypothetical protein
LQDSQHPFPNILIYRPQGSDEVSQEACGVIITFVKREPGDRSLITGDQFADQSGLAKASGGRNEGEFVTYLKPLVKAVDQMWSGNQVRP